MTLDQLLQTFLLCIACIQMGFTQAIYFKDVTELVGLDYHHDYREEIVPIDLFVLGGMAIGDWNNDGWVDLYVETGNIGPNLLFKNLGNGQFEECALEMGVALSEHLGGGPLFFDYNGDHWLDLIVGGISPYPIRLFQNKNGKEFLEVTQKTEIWADANTQSISAGDFNLDGHLDLFLAHWNQPNRYNKIWKNLGNGQFENVDEALQINPPSGSLDFNFSGSFSDINQDQFPDLLIASDFGTSQVWLNHQGKYFEEVTDEVISDENGMGSAIGDYNNDGRLDWLVTSIYDSDGVTEGNWGKTGNRLYQNLGAGHFADVTEKAQIRDGAWGWAASFADFNNDGFLDIVHTNGWPRGSDQFHHDTTRLYLSNQMGGFTEMAIEAGLIDTNQGRGLACFDFDRDGDLDILISNYRDQLRLWRNDSSNNHNYLAVKLHSSSKDVQPVGAKIFLYASGHFQMRELRCGTNYLSQNPLEAHFGLGTAPIVDSLIVQWPNGQIQKLYHVPVNQLFNLDYPVVQKMNNPMAIWSHPNPFSQTIHIHTEILSQGALQLDVFSLAGKHLKTVKNHLVFNGITQFFWDGKDRNGLIVPQGAYIAKISSINNESNHSMIILKQ